MKHTDLFTELMVKLAKREKPTSFAAIKRYLQVYYHITFTDEVLYNRLLDFKNTVNSNSNKDNNN